MVVDPFHSRVLRAVFDGLRQLLIAVDFQLLLGS
jgi:hypothetical protein